MVHMGGYEEEAKMNVLLYLLFWFLCDDFLPLLLSMAQVLDGWIENRKYHQSLFCQARDGLGKEQNTLLLVAGYSWGRA